jgi:septal ring-binding cell division protein DamX
VTSPADRDLTHWEIAGARVAGTLAKACAVLVTGANPAAAARAAIGIGRAESGRRRVAIGDLVGDVPPLVELVDLEDAHGIVDSFLYGVSLNKVAHPVTGAENLFVLPSGTEPVLTEEIFRSDRWRRLASGFREVGALLLLVAPSDAPGLDDLAAMLDGVVSVGDESGDIAARFPVLATVANRRTVASLRDTMAMPEIEAAEPATGHSAGGRWRRTREEGRAAPIVMPTGEEPSRVPRWLIPALLLVALAIGGGAALWVRDRQARATAAAADAARADSARAAAAASAAAPRDTMPAQVFTIMNPGDSAAAAAFAIEVAKHNTEEGARLGWEQSQRLPGVTWFPLRLSNDPNTWYRVVGGGFATREAADSALSALKATSALAPTASVLRAPLALLVGSQVRPDSVRAHQARFAVAGVHTYALRSEDGTFNVYAGAFETPDQSMFLALALQQLGDVPTLVYRTGRLP